MSSTLLIRGLVRRGHHQAVCPLIINRCFTQPQAHIKQLQTRNQSRWKLPRYIPSLKASPTAPYIMSFLDPVAVTFPDTSCVYDADPIQFSILTTSDEVKLMNDLPKIMDVEEITPSHVAMFVKRLLTFGFGTEACEHPFLNVNLFRAHKQLQDCCGSMGSSVLSHPNLHLMEKLVLENCHNFTISELTETLLSMLILFEGHCDRRSVHTLLNQCHKRLDELDLHSLFITSWILKVQNGIDPRLTKVTAQSFANMIIHGTSEYSSDELATVALTTRNLNHFSSRFVHYKVSRLTALHLQNKDEKHDLHHLSTFLSTTLSSRVFVDHRACFYIPICSEVRTRVTEMINQLQPHHIGEICWMLKMNGFLTASFASQIQEHMISFLDESLPVRDITSLLGALGDHISPAVQHQLESLLHEALLKQDIDQNQFNFVCRALTETKSQNTHLQPVVMGLAANFLPDMLEGTTLFYLTQYPGVNFKEQTAFWNSVLKHLQSSVLNKTQYVLVALSYLTQSERCLPKHILANLMDSISTFSLSNINRLCTMFSRHKLDGSYQWRKQLYHVQVAIAGHLHYSINHCYTTSAIIQIVRSVRNTPVKEDSVINNLLCDKYVELFNTFEWFFSHEFTELMDYLQQTQHYHAGFLDLIEKTLVKFDSISNPIFFERILRFMAIMGRPPVITDYLARIWTSILTSNHINRRKNSQIVKLRILREMLVLQIYPEAELAEVFSLNFLESLQNILIDDPSQVKAVDKLMLYLNRAVVLECPQLNVPWFHTEFCRQLDERVTTSSRDQFHLQVQETLHHVVNPRYVQANTFSPYGHFIQFKVVLNEHGMPVEDPGTVLPPDWQSVAILLWRKGYCLQNVLRVVGHYAHIPRQLQIMGYKVIEIPYFEWYSMALSDLPSREHYIRNKIFGS